MTVADLPRSRRRLAELAAFTDEVVAIVDGARGA